MSILKVLFVFCLLLSPLQATATFIKTFEANKKLLLNLCADDNDKVCFNRFIHSNSLEDKYNGIVLFISNPANYEGKRGIFNETLTFLINSGHKNSIILYSILLESGYLFKENINDSISLLKNNIDYKSDPSVLHLLGTYLIAQFIKNENIESLHEGLSYLEEAYDRGSIPSGIPLVLYYRSFSDRSRDAEVIQIINNLMKSDSLTAAQRRASEKLYKDYYDSTK